MDILMSFILELLFFSGSSDAKKSRTKWTRLVRNEIRHLEEVYKIYALFGDTTCASDRCMASSKKACEIRDAKNRQ